MRCYLFHNLLSFFLNSPKLDFFSPLKLFEKAILLENFIYDKHNAKLIKSWHISQNWPYLILKSSGFDLTCLSFWKRLLASSSSSSKRLNLRIFFLNDSILGWSKRKISVKSFVHFCLNFWTFLPWLDFTDI